MVLNLKVKEARCRSMGRAWRQPPVTIGNPMFVLNQDLPALTASLAALGEPAYRARQVWHWNHHRLAGSFAEMTDLPRDLRESLAAAFVFDNLRPEASLVSADELTHKVLFRLPDENTIETVLMLYDATDNSKARRTVCVSTQAGCGLGCTFCATGQGGLVRNLTPGEIVGQVLYFARRLAANGAAGAGAAPPAADKPVHPPITNVIFAGMGEPLANYNATLAAVRRLNDSDAFGLGARHMILSTAGLVPGILRLAKEDLQISLAVSLHAPTDELRALLMPINQRYPLAQLLPACREYVQETGRRIAFAGIGEAFVIKIHRVLGGQHHPYPKSARLF